ncbi:MAG: class I SAM-dependent methyltransferase [Rubripirellula sp.]|nr:SAM-dependent methyltransferase [Rhodopirellula sp.]MCH1439327.1 class I SAM-dependent methyltransferase [Rubripirellula sp.]OUX04450.1 MAG: SAM-dependent methyltransferase [Planctomycetaceae bacterium TMED240]
MTDESDPFFEAYNRDDIAYGETPAPGVQSIIDLSASGEPKQLRALDLGAGAGRDSIALARAGYAVTAVDLSEMGLERIKQRATSAGIGECITTRAADVRDFEFEPDNYDAIIATTVLDHIPAADALIVWKKILNSLTPTGLLAVEVHSTEDPGSDLPPGCNSTAPKSETTGAVVNYFSPNQLAQWATDRSADLRVLRYEERLEWDYTHGPEHMHGKVSLLAIRNGNFPEWYGQPRLFPRHAS